MIKIVPFFFIIKKGSVNVNFACGKYLSACRLPASLTRSAPDKQARRSSDGICEPNSATLRLLSGFVVRVPKQKVCEKQTFAFFMIAGEFHLQ